MPAGSDLQVALHERVSNGCRSRDRYFFVIFLLLARSGHPRMSAPCQLSGLDGRVTIFVQPHTTASSEGAMGEGIDIDAAGNLYTAEAMVRGVTKYVRD
jgi:hypothetical protein